MTRDSRIPCSMIIPPPHHTHIVAVGEGDVNFPAYLGEAQPLTIYRVRPELFYIHDASHVSLHEMGPLSSSLWSSQARLPAFFPGSLPACEGGERIAVRRPRERRPPCGASASCLWQTRGLPAGAAAGGRAGGEVTCRLHSVTRTQRRAAGSRACAGQSEVSQSFWGGGRVGWQGAAFRAVLGWAPGIRLPSSGSRHRRQPARPLPVAGSFPGVAPLARRGAATSLCSPGRGAPPRAADWSALPARVFPPVSPSSVTTRTSARSPDLLALLPCLCC